MHNDQYNTTDILVYHNLEEVRLRKANLQTELLRKEGNIRKLWNDIFHGKKKTSSKKNRISGIVNSSMGIIDGALLGWKLYRKFGGFKRKK
ncbi:MAG: hypothetical protein MR627_06735 [Prevotella sp.]|nr:hypothetical protein [Prevotella sp.]MDY2702799.1 hypothetical protein [Prevotella sp.]